MSFSTDPFFTQFARILNSGQSRSVILCGNIYDLFDNGNSYVPLIPYLCDKTQTDGLIQLVYEQNGPIRASQRNCDKLRDAWITWKSGVDANQLVLDDLTKNRSDAERLKSEFDRNLFDAK